VSSTAQIGETAVPAIVSLFKPGISERLGTTLAKAPAEYLAAMWVVENAGASEDTWRQFIANADSKAGAPETVKGFLAAVHDCCLAVAKEGPVPDFAVGELAKRSCLAPEATKQSRRRRRIRRLIESVQDAEEPSQVEHACTALAELGPEAHDEPPRSSRL
jgi:hypothetical protein